MDDLDYSVHIAERDWNSFYQESEECDLGQAALAGLDESGLSDFDESECCLSQVARASLEAGLPGPPHSIDCLTDCEGHPGEHLSTSGLEGPEDVVSGNEESEHHQAVNHEASEALLSTSAPAGGEPAFKIDSCGMINPIAESDVQDDKESAESVTDEKPLHIANNMAVESPLLDLATTEEPTSTGAQAGAQPCTDTPVKNESPNDGNEAPRKEKERWFVTVNVNQTRPRENVCPPVKKKRRKKSSSEDPLGTCHGFKGQDPAFQRDSEAERFLAKERQEANSNPHNFILDPLAEPEPKESPEPTIITETQHCKLENDHNSQIPTQQLYSVLQTNTSFQEYKEEFQKNQSVDDHQEGQNLTVGLNLQINSQLRTDNQSEQDNLSTFQQMDNTLESSPSDSLEYTAVATSNTPDHQNLLAKLLFSAQNDSGCGMSIFCKDSQQDTFPKFHNNVPSFQGDRKEESQQSLLAQMENNSTLQNFPKHSNSSQAVISIELPEPANPCFFETIPGSEETSTMTEPEKCYGQNLLGLPNQEDIPPEITDEQHLPPQSQNIIITEHTAGGQQVGSVQPKELLLEVPKIIEDLKCREPFVSEIHNSSGELSWTKVGTDYATSQKDESSDRQDEEFDIDHITEFAIHEPTNVQENSIFCLCDAKEVNVQVKNLTPQTDSTLSASENTQPLTFINDNPCLQSETSLGCSTEQAAMKYMMAVQPYVEYSTVQATCEPKSLNSLEAGAKDSSSSMLGDYISWVPQESTEDVLCPKHDCSTLTDSTECMITDNLPKFIHSPLGSVEGEVQELQSKEILTEDTYSTASVSEAHPHQLNADSSVEDEPALPQEQTTCNTEVKNTELDQVLDPSRPVYAISSFWDEMEKLTINDILHLRLVNNAELPRDSPQLQDSSMVDISDAADSGYFAHLDDSKPDRSSGDASLFSDFEEEYLQALSASTDPSPEPPDTKQRVRRSPESSCRVWWETDPDSTSTQPDSITEEGMTLCPEDAISQPLLSDSTRFSRTVFKSISVQNLQALETQSHAFKGSSLPTIVVEEERSGMLFGLYHTPEETCDPVFMERRSGLESSSPTFLSGDPLSEDQSYMMSFFEHSFADEERGASLSDRGSPVVPFDVGDSCNLSLPETYDYFFSEFEAGSFLFTNVRSPGDRKDEAVPIFTFSRSAKRKLRFSEEYDYFFPEDSPSESEDEDDCLPIRVVTRFDTWASEPLDVSTGPEMYEHFFTDWRANLFWRNPFSLRRVRFTGGLCSSRSISAPWTFATTDWRGKSVFRTMDLTNSTENRDSVLPIPNVFYLENQICREVAEQPRRCTDLQAVVSFPKKEGFLFTLRQSDMCLVCIAFASWVLKSTNPQSQDTWKTALLANVSAISAIQYLRRYVREETPRDKP